MSCNLTAEEYFRADGVSNSMLGKLEQSPLHLQSYLREPEESTREQELGTDFHNLALLAESPQNIAIKPAGMTFTTREGKAWRAEQEQAGKRIMTDSDFKALYGMFDSIMANKPVRAAIETGVREHALFAPFTLGGTVMRKCRIDLVPTSAALLDFKTTTDASKKAFAATVFNYGYYRQAAYYLDIAEASGFPHTEFVFVAVEKKPPYAHAVYHLEREAINEGRRRYIDLLTLYMRCRDENRWPGYLMEPQAIGLPHWAMREMEAA